MSKKGAFVFFTVVMTAMAVPAFATNGDNLIGIGPISRAMGGVGIAAPQDSISAVFANPAGMCFSSYCNASTADFAGTMFMPKVEGKVIEPNGTVKADSRDSIYAIPAIGVSTPLSPSLPAWRFGIAAYGVTGLGVDYRGTDLDNPERFDYRIPMGNPEAIYPLISGEYTSLQVMKFAPALAVQATDRLSVGVALHIDYASLDLKNGSSPNYGYGYQLGILTTPVDNLAVGLSYTSPQDVVHNNISDLDGNGSRDDLELEAPQQLGFGIAYTILDPAKVTIEADAKWINWSDAKGYKDFDWNDQMVYSIGVQCKPVSALALRAGFNYARSPVAVHDGFNGAFSAANMTPVQDVFFPNYYYETFRIIGFPAVVEKHLTFGAGYQISKNFSLNAGYMHAIKNTITETGTNLNGETVTLESSLSESSYDFGMTWLF